MAAPMERLRVLEFYSGIGGMHFALKESGVEHEVVGAVDINTVGNTIYRHNFPETKLLQRSIESLSIKELEKLSPDMVVMSPPCQPFTRVGNQKDEQDPRTKSFFHVLEILPRLPKPPQYILVENVKGFDSSYTRKCLLEMLIKNGYHHQEFLLTPLQFGIPNSRLRYYLIARNNFSFNFQTSDQIMELLPQTVKDVNDSGHLTSQTVTSGHNSISNSVPGHCSIDEQADYSNNTSLNPTCTHVIHEQSLSLQMQNVSCTDGSPDQLLNASLVSHTESNQCTDSLISGQKHESDKWLPFCKLLKIYLEEENEDYFNAYLLSDKDLKLYGCMDIVKEESRKSCCFTKRYGHYMDGAGSVIQMNSRAKISWKAEPSNNDLVELRQLKLRYFTPREISNLLCFPAEFVFPPDVTRIQRYRVLGNSLNVHVVAKLIQLLVNN